MKISLIGMSNSGKSYLSKKLQEEGFLLFDCDQRIAEKLRLADIGDVATWMGHPYDPHYTQRSSRYLELEQEAMQEILRDTSHCDQSHDIVIDTTGSVIYIDKSILDALRHHTMVVYLDTPEPVREEMYLSYLRHPKPVIWGELFAPLSGETIHDTLARCYPLLLDYRTTRYKNAAHLTLDYFWLRHPAWTIQDMLTRIA